MGIAIALRDDYDGAFLRHLAKAARMGSVGLQVIRDWALGFNARGPEGLVIQPNAARS